MAGIVPKQQMETDEESDTELSNVFMGPITKEELLAPIIKRNKKVPSIPKIHIGTHHVIAHENMVTPAKAYGNNNPLDLSVKKANPMVVDLSTPVASKTILIPDTPNYSSILNESDFMDMSDMCISVDNVLVDLQRDIESDIEMEMEKSRQSQNPCTLYLNTFNTKPTQILNASHVQPNEDKLVDTIDSDIHLPINSSTLNMINPNSQSLGGQILKESSHNRNLPQFMDVSHVQPNADVSHVQPYLHNESSLIKSELSSVLNTTEEQSFLSGKDSSSTEDGKSYQDVLSESFQYYAGSELNNKENDSNQLNHASNIPVVIDENTHLNQTFERTSISQTKTGSFLHVPPNSAEDTLEEIDILETYGYKIAEKDKIPTINILSATIVEETAEDTESHDCSKYTKSVPHINVSAINKSENVNDENLLEMADQKKSEFLNKLKEESNISAVELNDHVKSEVLDEYHLSEIVNPSTDGYIDQGHLSMNDISHMLAETSIQAKENIVPGQTNAMETSALNNQSCVDLISRDSCVGLYVTVNATLGENTGLYSPCSELSDEADDLNLSVIDNTDATKHWKEINSANNTVYIDLSPIKKNVSNHDGIDQITVESTDHTYAHGEPSNKSASSSGIFEEEVVQLIYVNENNKLVSIVEEHEPMDKDITDVEEENLQIEVKGGVTLLETGDVSMKHTEEAHENRASLCAAYPEDPLNETFNEDIKMGAADDVEEIVLEPAAKLEVISNNNIEEIKTSILSSQKLPSANERIKQTDQTLPKDGIKKDQDIRDQNPSEGSNVSVKKLKSKSTDVHESSSHAVHISSVNEIAHDAENKLNESRDLDTAENENTAECVITDESLRNKTIGPLISDMQESKTEQENKINDKSIENVDFSIERKNVSTNKTEQIDLCNNTAQKTSMDGVDFKSVVQKYQENTGLLLSTTSELPSFVLESFSKPRHVNDDMNSSSPDVEASKKDLKRSSLKPKSQIPTTKRANVLRPTKFTNENIKLVPKPLSKVHSAEKLKPLNGSTLKIQKENIAVPSPKVKASPVTPARSISQTLVSSISSFANKITGRTPRKENTPKIKSPEQSKLINIKSSKPSTQMKSPKLFQSSSKPGSKCPNASNISKYTPMLSKFKNLPSSTPAVKVVSKTPTPQHKTSGQEVVRKSLSASRLEGQHKKTPSSQAKFDLSLNNRKLDFKNVESKIGSIRKPDELPSLQNAVKSPSSSTAKSSVIKPPKFTGSKLPSLLPASIPVKRTSKFLNIQSPIGAYIRDGSKAVNDSKKQDTSFIPRKLLKLNQTEGQDAARPVLVSMNSGTSVPVSDVSMCKSPVILQQKINTSDSVKHTAL